ncbi:FUSC family protein [Photobacterium damselae subsp. damselae]|uniref:FUSC family protein n=1 Tax=Photobacterium damselae TaxID=38293 RepID=UPI00311AD15E
MVSNLFRQMWYSPQINTGIRAFSAIVLIMGIGAIVGEINSAMTALMTLPAALISGLDVAGPRRWTRFFITLLLWSGTLVFTYLLLSLQLPLWLIFGMLSTILVSMSVNGPFWGRLGMSSILIAAVTLSLFKSNTVDFIQYTMLIFGPLLFSLFSWLWFLLWKDYALRVSLSAIYQNLSLFIGQRVRFLLGHNIEDEWTKIKFQLVELFEQAFQSEAFRMGKKTDDTLKNELVLALDIFEGLLSSHTQNPDLLFAIQNDIKKQKLLIEWKNNCQQRLQIKVEQLLKTGTKTHFPEQSILAITENLIYLLQVDFGQQPRFIYWASAIKHVSKRIEFNEQTYERQFNIQPFILTFIWPRKDNPIWKHTARITLIYMLGAGLAQYFQLLHPEWVLISILMVIQPTFSAVRSRILHRCLGTISGGLLAILFLHMGISNIGIFVVIAILLPVAMFNILRNYSIAIGCITAMLILVFQIMTSQGMSLVGPRLIDNIIGCITVLAGYSILWPQWRGKEIHDQSLKALGAAKKVFITCYQQLQLSSEYKDANQLSLIRAELLNAENALELIYSEMQQEPKFTRKAPAYYEKVISQYHLLSHYLCLLLPLARSNTQTLSPQWLEHIEQSIDALILSVKEHNVIDLPCLNKTVLQELDSPSIETQTVAELMWLSLMTIKQLHDLVRDNIENNNS